MLTNQQDYNLYGVYCMVIVVYYIVNTLTTF
jgi:hypothetical protein